MPSLSRLSTSVDTTASVVEEGARNLGLPAASADLLLLHAPAFFDFRHRRGIYFPFLGTSGDVSITPLYAHIPIDFKTLHRLLEERGHRVKFASLSSIMPRYPRSGINRLIDAFDARLIGIDLQWMVHVQESLALTNRIKVRHTTVPVIFESVSSILYANELVPYIFVEKLMRGYDTRAPMAGLLDARKAGMRFGGILNPLWVSVDG